MHRQQFPIWRPILSQLENESYYYHGRIYLRALAQGLSSDTTLSLYLDQTDGLLGKDVNGTLLNAARLGLGF